MQWSIIREIGFQFFMALLVIIIALKTSPENFSVTFWVILIFSIFNIFSESFISSTIIQSKSNLQHLMLSMTFLAFSSAVFFSFIFFQVISYSEILYIFSKPFNLEVMSSLTIFMIIMSAVPYGLNRKNRNFKIIALIDIFSSLVGFTVSMIIISQGDFIEALIIFLFTRSLLIVILLFMFTRIEIDVRNFYVFFNIKYASYGLKLAFFSLLKLLVRDADKIIIGSFLGPIALGLYAFVENIVIRPGALIMNGISRFNFSIFCNETLESKKIDKAYSNNLSIASLIILFLISPIILLSPYVINVFFDDSWQDSIGLFLPLFGLILIKTLFSPIGDFWKSQENFMALYAWSFSILILTASFAFVGSQTSSVIILAYLILFLNLIYLLINFMLLKSYFIKEFINIIQMNYIRSITLFIILITIYFLNQMYFDFSLTFSLISIIIFTLISLIIMKPQIKHTKFYIHSN